MNRLILIGNGFDLAHGLKTDYNSFIVWYLKKCLTEAYRSRIYEDDLLKVSQRNRGGMLDYNYIKTISDIVDFFYLRGFVQLIDNEQISIPERQVYWQEHWDNPFLIEIKSPLLRTLITKCKDANWVDIENEFYRELKFMLSRPKNKNEKIDSLNALNDSLKFIISKLQDYLVTIEMPPLIPDYKKIFESRLNSIDIFATKRLLNISDLPEKSLIVNFNYTGTAAEYFIDELISDQITINHIHGKIDDAKNPMIFGFGDELDGDYAKIELEKINAYFKYIKSFWYFKTSNYHDLIRFIESEDFQVFILGHSCGLSDRTMLNMIFEHENCKSIKVFYYVDSEGQNNFENLTQEISRHFKDKASMRKKIVPFDKSEPMPQIS
ncbi:AbiH family protein [Mucilaginibacter pankratovii]|uniref:AbiH family protein n=1 Tax=Mucilaginibacter pankratovii TaxID=2772110 RepID=UPI001CD0ACE1|nr:AbiH family protein [Mucilaginibacter pankratovii]